MSVVELIGWGTILLVVVSTLRVLWKYFLQPATNLSVYGAHDDSWAMITGSSGGIGLGFARQLAKRGFNIVLTARSVDTLNSIATELESEYKIKTRVVAVDASVVGTASGLAKAVEDLHLRVLVNNVGINTSIPMALEDASTKEVRRVIEVNCIFSTELTSLLIPQLKRTAKRCAILNLSSITAGIPSPYLACYAATKAYNDSFSRSLSAELNEFGIDVLSLTPAYVISKLSSMKRASLSVLTADHFAALALGMIGKGFSVSPYWYHAGQMALYGLIPEHYLGSSVLATMKSVNLYKLKKMAAREKKE